MATVEPEKGGNGLQRTSRKRHHEEGSPTRTRSKHSRKSERRGREDDEEPSPSRKSSPPPSPKVSVSSGASAAEQILTIEQIKKIVEDRKIQVMKSMPQPSSQDAKMTRQMELQAKISAALAGRPELFGATNFLKVPNLSGSSTLTPGVSKPTPLILDAEGRTIDLVTGKAVTLEQRGPTLKANIRAKRREDFKAVQDKVADEARDEQPDFYDPRVGTRQPTRAHRKTFNFVEQGSITKQWKIMETKKKLDNLQNEIASQAKRTGITSAAALARIAPKKDDWTESGRLPVVEPWDKPFPQPSDELMELRLNPDATADLFAPFLEDLKKRLYEAVEVRSDGSIGPLLSWLIEHPLQMDVPIDKDKSVPLPMMLTKKEQKKLRRQTRREKLKEEQEKQRLGLTPAPEPKVKMANLMRVLGSEAVQDPTKVEATVRAQIAKRRKIHETANASRKLSEDDKRKKKMKKMKEDTSEEVHVAIYRVKDLSHPAKKFKIETNANQLFMTGVVVLNKEINMVVVEGGPKQQKKFKRLVLNRIKWTEDSKTSSHEPPESSSIGSSMTRMCELVWEGTRPKRHFGPVKFKSCPTEQVARALLNKHNVEEYWDLAYGAAILESTDY